MPRAVFLFAAALVAGAGPAAAQMHPGASPYADMQSREIKALSPEEVTGLLAGDGLGFALAAELNGLPGPKHVLEFADSIGLSGAQREAVERITDEMRARAVDLGTRLVEAERALDGLFASGAATAGSVRASVDEAERIRAELRTTHLVAHLATVGVLRPEQIQAYRHLRGYHVHQ